MNNFRARLRSRALWICAALCVASLSSCYFDHCGRLRCHGFYTPIRHCR